MPIPTAPTTERLYMEGLVSYLNQETGIPWRVSPRPPMTTGSPEGAIWVSADLGFIRPNNFADTSRRQVLTVYWSLRDTVANAGSVSDWKEYLIRVFKGIQREGLQDPLGAFKGMTPQTEGTQVGEWLFNTASTLQGEIQNANSIVEYGLQFRYIYPLPGQLGC